MLPSTAFLAAAILAHPGSNGSDDVTQAPEYHEIESDDHVNFTIPRTNRPGDGDFGKFYNTTDQSLFLTKLTDRKVVIVSARLKGVQSAAILRVSNDPHLRFGVEWARNQSFVNGDKDNNGRHYGAVASHAVRFIGMHEVNDVVKRFSLSASNYLFNNMTWSGFTSTIMTTAEGARMINLNTAATSNGLTFNFVVHVSDTPNATLGVSPFGIKYDLHITGTPIYKLQNSHYRLINLVHNSNKAYESLNGTEIGYGATAYTWVTDVTVDGSPASLTSTLINQTTSLDDTKWFNVTKAGDHESSLDFYSSKVILGFDIPKFTSSFYWDPTVSVDNEKATQDYQVSGAVKTGSWLGLASLAAVAMILL